VLHTYYSIIVLLFTIGLVISSVEFLYILPHFHVQGVYSWRVLATEQRQRLGWMSSHQMVKWLGDTRLLTGLLGIRLASPIVLLFLHPQTGPFAVVSGLLLLTMLAFTLRRYIGDDGSDQMNGIITMVLFLCAGLGRDERLLYVGLYFLAFQACLSYLAAGVAKALSPEWRDGSAIFKIFNTEAYGIRPVATWLAGKRALQWILAWSVIVVECFFPLVVVLPLPLAALLLTWGVVFHVLCAVIMGLNSFLWAFTATYPAIVFVNLQLRSLVVG